MIGVLYLKSPRLRGAKRGANSTRKQDGGHFFRERWVGRVPNIKNKMAAISFVNGGEGSRRQEQDGGCFFLEKKKYFIEDPDHKFHTNNSSPLGNINRKIKWFNDISKQH